MAQIAFDVNRSTQNIGARRLYTILERVFETISFEAPDLPEKDVKITGAICEGTIGRNRKRRGSEPVYFVTEN